MNNEKTHRVEEDFLGTMNINNENYYGIQTLRAVENFPITGQQIDEELIRGLGMVKFAAARANHRTGQLTSHLADAIEQASREVIDRKWHDQFIVDPIQGGAGTSINMNANEVIANRALELLGEEKGNNMVLSVNSHVNMSQSTNDAFPTAFKIALLNRLNQVLDVMESMHLSLLEKTYEFENCLKMGRTHLQDAVPIRLGQEFSSYAAVIKRDINRIKTVKETLYETNMGATAVGTGLNADPDYITYVIEELALISGYPMTTSPNLVDGTQNTDVYVTVSGALKTCMSSLSKISNDLRLMASGPRTGLNEILLPPRQPGSSIMPGKVNPVMAEAVNQVAFKVIGNDVTVTLASEAGQFELNVMEPVLVSSLLDSIKMMTNVIDVFNNYCIQDIKANTDRMEQYVNQSVGIITAINPHIGYEPASSIAKEAISSGRPVREICIERGVLSEEELDLILDPYKMTTPGISERSIEQIKG
ncbi:aspartate ammonia-lyase [Salisediminibacterium halotolerans]|uniref:aspartate ammonia-lyase n=1 Tax=Salisediminibacterium halotolerans TaxID=517425 RepID=A0A1H9SX53_9BACI|nr:aspartate ammonia-lyase [Salisediminibacterium haloalkalitolerans]SER88963.1 aspartate ammonia-lyase [Salisediminibacterium haloalkalitolerans]